MFDLFQLRPRLHPGVQLHLHGPRPSRTPHYSQHKAVQVRVCVVHIAYGIEKQESLEQKRDLISVPR